MGIFGAMARAAGKEIKKAVRKKLRKVAGRPVKVGRATSTKATKRRKKKLPASSVTRRTR
jgi:hypothetical protein